MTDLEKELKDLPTTDLFSEETKTPLRRSFDAAIKTAKKAAIISAIAVAAVGSGYEWLEYEWPIKDGSSQGRITEFAKEGVHTNILLEFLTAPVCKTWEGHMAQENSSVEADGVLSNTFRFSVQDDRVAEEIHRAYDSRKKVSLTFVETSKHIECFRKSNTLVTGVRVLEDVAADGQMAPIMMQQKSGLPKIR